MDYEVGDIMERDDGPDLVLETRRQFDDVGCYDCGTEWETELGYLAVNPDEIRCPECGTVVGFTRGEREAPVFWVQTP